MIIACQVKEIQICSELRKMAEMGIGITKDTAEDLIKQKFEFPLARAAEDEDALLRGEFSVIKQLLAALPGAAEAKAKIDRIIDMCGPGPRGTGMQNLRWDLAPAVKCLLFSSGNALSRPSGSMTWLLRTSRSPSAAT